MTPRKELARPCWWEPRAIHRLDEGRLAAYLAAELPGFAGPLTVRQFQGGQSNPTYHLHTPGAAWVLRKKSPGPCCHPPTRSTASMPSTRPWPAVPCR